MSDPMLKERMQAAAMQDPLFRQGRRHVRLLALIYMVVRFSDPFVSALVTHTPLQLDDQGAFGLLVAALVAWLALCGRVRLAGALCLLTPAANGLMLFLSAQLWGGFSALLQQAPTAWPVLIGSLICLLVGILLLTDKPVRYYGQRRRALGRESMAPAEATPVFDQEEWEDKEEAPTTADDVIDADISTPEYAVEVALAAEETPATVEKATKAVPVIEPPQPAKPESEAAAPPPALDNARLLAEFPGETAALRAESKSNRLSGVGNQRIFELYRDMLCRRFSCVAEQADAASYVLTFPSGGKLLLRWLQGNRSLYLESDTERYGADFHQQALDAVAYLSKQMGVGFTVKEASPHDC